MQHKDLKSRDTLPETLPVFPLEGALLLPGGQLPLNVFEPRYLRMVDDALSGARLIGMIQPKPDGVIGGPPELYDVGCAGRITSFSETDDGRYVINLTGSHRFRLGEELSFDAPYRLIRPDWSSFDIDDGEDATVGEIDRDGLLAALHRYLEAEQLHVEWDQAAEAPAEALVVSLAMGCPFAPNEKQALLEARTMAEQARCLITLMQFSGVDEQGDDPLMQ